MPILAIFLDTYVIMYTCLSSGERATSWLLSSESIRNSSISLYRVCCSSQLCFSCLNSSSAYNTKKYVYVFYNIDDFYVWWSVQFLHQCQIGEHQTRDSGGLGSNPGLFIFFAWRQTYLLSSFSMTQELWGNCQRSTEILDVDPPPPSQRI